MHIIRSHASEYFPFYDEYRRIHYDDEMIIMLDMMHGGHCSSRRPGGASPSGGSTLAYVGCV